MKVFIKTILISFIFIKITLSQIITIDSIDGLKAELDKADVNTLVIFDCDDVLLYKTDSILKRDNADKLKRCINFAFIRHPFAYFHMDSLKWIVLKKYHQILVHNDLPSLVAKLQNRNIKVIVLTAMINKTTKEGSFINLRVEELYKFGFDFSRNWNNLKERPLIDQEESPYYKQGIICSGHKSKSVALDLFLKYSGFNPKKIIFIDDSKKNLKDVKIFSEKAEIDFLGIEYTAYKKIPQYNHFSQKRADFQLENLITNKVWLSDEEADLKLKIKCQ